MKLKPKVDIAVACSNNQVHQWWNGVMAMLLYETKSGIEIGRIITSSSALPDSNKNNAIGAYAREADQKGRQNKTDANRNYITKSFLGGNSDWVFMIDDDTVPPIDTLSRLLSLDKLFVAGLYFNGNPPYNPIAYVRETERKGLYSHIYDYPYGMLVEVDAVGMGCTLIHRTVFEKIAAAHELFVRPNGSLFPILRTNVHKLAPAKLLEFGETFVVGDYAVQKVEKVRDDDERLWPFFLMEHGRTEDLHFCELAANVGIRPWVDTSINCEHIKSKSYGYEDYRRIVNEYNDLE